MCLLIHMKNICILVLSVVRTNFYPVTTIAVLSLVFPVSVRSLSDVGLACHPFFHSEDTLMAVSMFVSLRDTFMMYKDTLAVLSEFVENNIIIEFHFSKHGKCRSGICKVTTG